MDMNYAGGMWEGGGWAGWSGVGGKWDNCNSIINKYIKKKFSVKSIPFLNFINISNHGRSIVTWPVL